MSRLAGTLEILRAWPGQRQIPFRPREEVARLRERRARELARYAAAHVPYYRQLAREGWNAGAVRGVGDLAALPILSRADLVDDVERVRSPLVDRSSALRIRTSGTTGQPLDVFHDRGSALANIAYSERERAPDIAVLGRRAGYRIFAVEYSRSTYADVRRYYDENAFRPARPHVEHVPSELRLDSTLEALERVRPDVVLGPGSWVGAIFEALATMPGRHLPRLVVYGGAILPGSARKLIEGELGIPVHSRYNAGEALKIGYFCEQRDGFHVHEDLCHVEIVDAAGNPAPAGEEGDVVIANLVNRGTVLLRYRLGDRARLDPRPCPCGRTSPKIVGLDGKTNPLIQLPDGSALHARGLWGVIKAQEGVRRFRLVQQAADRFLLELETRIAKRTIALQGTCSLPSANSSSAARSRRRTPSGWRPSRARSSPRSSPSERRARSCATRRPVARRPGRPRSRWPRGRARRPGGAARR